MQDKKIKIGLVGCGGMGKGQAKTIASLPDFALTAVCDISRANAEEAAKETNAEVFTDYKEMFKKCDIDAAAITTGNSTHAEIAIFAAESGVKGIYCEKPMAVNLFDARKMTDICKRKNIPLIINHQRRLGEDLKTARRLIEEGAIGNVYLIRGQCAGDVLSDGTHLIDSLLFLSGDSEPEWVLGQLHRDIPKDSKPYKNKNGREVIPGMRYGHPVEKGAAGFFQLKNGIRCEILAGDMIETCRTYQDYEIFGSNGRIWRCGDRLSPNLFIQDGKGGDYNAGIDESFYPYKPILCKEKGKGIWRPVESSYHTAADKGGSKENSEIPVHKQNLISVSYMKFAEILRNGGEHPLSTAAVLRGFEINMGIYESARLNKKLTFPIEQERFPLEIMIEKNL
jgi:predicted dehydrogenase